MRTAEMKSNEECGGERNLGNCIGTYEHIIYQFPTSVALELSWSEHRTSITRSLVQIPLKF